MARGPSADSTPNNSARPELRSAAIIGCVSVDRVNRLALQDIVSPNAALDDLGSKKNAADQPIRGASRFLQTEEEGTIGRAARPWISKLPRLSKA